MTAFSRTGNGVAEKREKKIIRREGGWGQGWVCGGSLTLKLAPGTEGGTGRTAEGRTGGRKSDIRA